MDFFPPFASSFSYCSLLVVVYIFFFLLFSSLFDIHNKHTNWICVMKYTVYPLRRVVDGGRVIMSWHIVPDLSYILFIGFYQTHLWNLRFYSHLPKSINNSQTNYRAQNYGFFFSSSRCFAFAQKIYLQVQSMLIYDDLQSSHFTPYSTCSTSSFVVRTRATTKYYVLLFNANAGMGSSFRISIEHDLKQKSASLLA